MEEMHTVPDKKTQDATQPLHLGGQRPLSRPAGNASHNTFCICHQPERKHSHVTNNNSTRGKEESANSGQ